MTTEIVPRITGGKKVLNIKKLSTRPHVWNTASLKDPRGSEESRGRSLL